MVMRCCGHGAIKNANSLINILLTGAWAPISLAKDADRAEVVCCCMAGAKAVAEAARAERRTNFMVILVLVLIFD